MSKPRTTMQIVAAIADEVERQHKLWGDDFDKKNTANDWAAYIVHYLSEATYSGRKPAFTAKKFILNMQKVAAMAVSAIKIVEQEGGIAPRHYEGLPRSGATE